ncbi:unnamed protein product [Choristocarpus tenellus]
MSSGAIDASFQSEGGGNTLNFPYSLLRGFDSPEAASVRMACWCMCFAGAALSVGFRSNGIAMASFLLQFYVLLLDKALYTDEAYLFALTAFLLSLTDCGLALGLHSEKGDIQSYDGGRPVFEDKSRVQPPDTIPHWHMVLLRFQVGIVHIHQGLAKASTKDWLLGGEPFLHTLMTMPSDHMIRRGAVWAANHIPWLGGGGLQALAVRLNVSSAFLDLFVGVSLLAVPDYKPIAVALRTIYHLGSAVMLGHATRNWHLLMLSFGVLSLNPGHLAKWVQHMASWLQPGVSHGGAGEAARRQGRKSRLQQQQRQLRKQQQDQQEGTGGCGGGNSTGINATVGEGGGKGAQQKRLPLQQRPSTVMAVLVMMYVAVQVLLPLRHLLTAFPVEWGREGHEFSWRGGQGGLLREEALLRVMHRPRARTGEMNNIHLYQAPFTAQQVVNRMVLDPEMILQLVRVSAPLTPPGSRTRQDISESLSPPQSYVDAWKSVNGRPFMRLSDPTVDLWGEDGLGWGEGRQMPLQGEWLQTPLRDWELESSLAAIEVVRSTWSSRGQHVTFFAGRPGQALSNIFLGGYDPSNLNTTELCSVASEYQLSGPMAQGGGDGESPSLSPAGILMGVITGQVDILTSAPSGVEASAPNVRRVVSGDRPLLAPVSEGHTVRVMGTDPGQGLEEGRLAVWYYVHACPESMFHLCIGFLSTGGWGALYPPLPGLRKGWFLPQTM